MKKLLGLLAVAPLSLAACGGNDTVETAEVAVQNDVRYVAALGTEGSQLIVSGIDLEDADDNAGYNALGKAIREAYDADKTVVGASSELKMTGEFDGTKFNKTVDYTTVNDNTGSNTAFTTLGGILDHTYNAEGTLTADGAMAKALKTAGVHADAVPATAAEIAEFDLLLNNDTHFDVEMTQSEWDDEFYEADSTVREYAIGQLDEFTGLPTLLEDIIISAFESTSFVFENYYVIRNNRVIMYYHHETDANTQQYIHWYATTATA